MYKPSSVTLCLVIFMMTIKVSTLAHADVLGGLLDKVKKGAEDVIIKTVEETTKPNNPQPTEALKDQPKIEEVKSKPQTNTNQASTSSQQIEKDVFTSPAEVPPMEVINKETAQVKKECATSSPYNSYQDCQCVAETFKAAQLQGMYKLAKNIDYENSKKNNTAVFNERKDRLRPNNYFIFKSIYNVCPNKTTIKATELKTCVSYQKNIIENYQQYCECRSDSIANDFVNEPILDHNYIDRLKRKAGRECNAIK